MGTQDHTNIVYQLCSEGIVLLENYQVLPLQEHSTVSVFSNNQNHLISGGVGSGKVLTETKETFMELLEQHYELDQNIKEIYRNFDKNTVYQERAYIQSDLKILDEEVIKASKENETAIMIISRNSGEGLDVPPIKGGYYLTDEETSLSQLLMNHFSKTIFIINSGVSIDTSWYQNHKDIAVLYVWYPGVQGWNACVDVLLGKVNPSGKLTSTLPKSYDDLPSANLYKSHIRKEEHKYLQRLDKGIYHKLGIKETGWNLIPDVYVKYHEDIYNGYRFFETFDPMYERVNYEFGYGLSYTRFKIEPLHLTCQDNVFHLSVSIKNIGDIAGKETVQVYLHMETDTNLEQPYKILVGFSKTKLLSPDQQQRLVIEVPFSHIEVFDPVSCCYKLEKGEYQFFIGNSIKDANQRKLLYDVREEIILQKVKHLLEPKEEIRVLTQEKVDMSILNQDEVDSKPIQEIPCMIPTYEKASFDIDSIKDIPDYSFSDLVMDKIDIDTFMDQMHPAEFAYICTGNLPDHIKEGKSGPLFVEEIPGAAGSTREIKRLNIPKIFMADGPSGIRLETNSIQFPAPVLQACTWNKELLYTVGMMMASEAKKYGIHVVLAPALNIQRNPQCGRNYEYYSEDPVLSGCLASAIVSGMQDAGVLAQIKHFALNNIEEDRERLDVIVSERAIRDIYLKAFKLVIQNAKPAMIMSAYNKINGVYCSENKELLTDILRTEWGYEGVVVTDWEAAFVPFGNEQYTKILAQNDMFMPGGKEDFEALYGAYIAGKISLETLKRSAKNILLAVLKVKKVE